MSGNVLTIGQKLQKVASYVGLSQRKFAEEIGVSSNYISVLAKNPKRGISYALACLIEQKFGINSNWLLKNEEPMIKSLSKNVHLNPIKRKLISKIENLTEPQAAAVLSFLAFVEDVEDNVEWQNEQKNKNKK